MPIVSVIMPAYNAMRYLPDAIASILAQTFSDWELIVVCDPSTDGTRAWLAAQTDPRVRVICNPQPLTLTPSRNVGLAQARGEFIALHDADDIALPERLARQVEFLRAHPEVGLLGASFYRIDPAGKILWGMRQAQDDLRVRWLMFVDNPLCNSSVMIRARELMEHALTYDEHIGTVEDYQLWARLLRFTRAAVLADSLVLYRVHPQSHTVAHKPQSVQVARQIAESVARAELPGAVFTSEQYAALFDLHRGISPAAQCNPLTVELYLNLLIAFLNRHADDSETNAVRRFATVVALRMLLRCPFSGAWMRGLRRIVAINPGVTFDAMCTAFHLASQRWQRVRVPR